MSHETNVIRHPVTGSVGVSAEGQAKACISDPSYRLVRMHALGDVLREHRRSRPEMIAVVDGEVRLSWKELDSRVNRLAHALAAKGVEQGERVLWLGQNSFRIIETLLAAAKLGAVFCPANWRMSGNELARVVEDFDPRVVIWEQEEVEGACIEARNQCQANRHWLCHDQSGDGGYEALLDAESDADIDQLVVPELPVLAVYTAAFEGLPNAALLPHSTVLFQSLTMAYGDSVNEETVFLNSGPLFHLGTLMSLLSTFLFGGRNVFIRRMEVHQLLSLIQSEGVTHALIPQPTVEQIREVNATGAYDVSSLWATPDAREWVSPRVIPADAPFMKHMSGYGQTEVMGLCVLGWCGGTGAGRPSPMIQVRIVDDEGQEVEPGVVGEIVIRGSLVMAGYFNRSEENAFRSRGGWHHTNDLGKRLEDGSIVFVGPKTTMIKSGVENIYPVEVENCLRSHPAIENVCVIGVPDPTWSQNVRAVVVLKEGHQASEQSLIEHCREHIASYKKPKDVVFVNELPLTKLGLVDREAVDAAHGGGGYPSAG